jgi:hypothetical protein
VLLVARDEEAGCAIVPRLDDVSKMLLFFVARGDPVLGLVADDRLDSLGSTYAMLVKQLDTGLQADHLQELQTYFFFGWQHTPISFLARNR